MNWKKKCYNDKYLNSLIGLLCERKFFMRCIKLYIFIHHLRKNQKPFTLISSIFDNEASFIPIKEILSYF